MSEYGRRAWVEVSYEGKNISSVLTNDLKAFSYKDNINACDEISITVLDRGEKWLKDWITLKGDEITAKIITLDKDVKSTLDCGTFYLDDKDFGQGWFQFKGISVDITSTMKNEEKTKMWTKTSLKKIGQTIATQEKLAYKFTGKDVSIAQAQQKASNGGFLQQICVQHGFSVKIIKKTLYIAELSDLESLEADIVIEKAYCSENWKINETDNDTYTKCIIEYKDPILAKKVKGEASIKRLGYKKEPEKTFKITNSLGVKGKTVEEINKQLNKIASGKLREKNQEELSISLSLMGNTKIVSGRTIKIKGWGQYDQYKYVILSAEHSYGDGYRVNIEARRCLNI